MEEPDFKRPRVGIIGGRGRMGQWLARRLEQDGYQVEVADAADGPLPPGLVEECQVLVLAVPIPQVGPVMAEIGPRTRPDGLVVDIASLKEGPLKAMLAQAQGEVLGCHPLFGPSAPSLLGQVVFICPGRGGAWSQWFRGWLAAGGARLVEVEPQAHDRLMAQVQSLRHFLLYGLGAALKAAGFDPGHDLPLAGPWFQCLAGLLERQLHQPPELYADLALHNPHAPAVVAGLAQSLTQAAERLAAQDRPGLIELMERAADFPPASLAPKKP